MRQSSLSRPVGQLTKQFAMTLLLGLTVAIAGSAWVRHSLGQHVIPRILREHLSLGRKSA